MERPPTRLITLHRLIRLSSIDDAPSALSTEAELDGGDPDDGAEPQPLRSARVMVDVGGCPAFWLAKEGPHGPASWMCDVEHVLGADAPMVREQIREQSSGGVLVVQVDGWFYAISFGQGFRWIKDEFRDQRFGLKVAVRCLDPDSLHGIRRRRAGQGRIENSQIPGGAPVAWLRPRDLSEIVRQIAGSGLNLTLTYQPRGQRGARLEGASGLRLRLGLRGQDLVSDIRTIRSVYAQPNPLPELSFVDDVAPVDDEDIENQLNDRMERLLDQDHENRLAFAVPDNALVHLPAVRSYGYTVCGTTRRIHDLTLSDLVAETAAAEPGERWAALGAGRVRLYDVDRGGKALHGTPASRWVEASISIGDEQFVLLDGIWHRFAAHFATQLRREVGDVLRSSTYGGLPIWRPDEDEQAYNQRVADDYPGFLCLDRKLVRDEVIHLGRGLELCDLLGPNNELIHVKRAKGSAALSHLFAQGLVSWQTLRGHTETRTRFRNLVERLGHTTGRTLAEGFMPQQIVLAIQLGTGRPLSANTLFPFAQAALAHLAAELRTAQVRLDVVGIPAMDQASAA